MPRVLITGAGGLLGGYLVRAATARGLDVVPWSGRADVDLADPESVAAAYLAARPDVTLHAAAMARIDECEREPERARQVNARAAAHLAELAQRHGAHLLYVSTDMVFSGSEAPYAEDALPRPLSHYGVVKAEGEAGVLAHSHAVARVSLLVGPSLTGKPTFFGGQAEALRGGKSITLFEDEWRTPLDLSAAAEGLLDLALARAEGVWHLGGPERLSRLEMGLLLARALGADESACVAVKRPADRPRDLSLDCSKWRAAFPSSPWPTLSQAWASARD